MSSQIIDGKKIASEIRDELKKDIETNDLKPTLAVILVGDRKDSETYVRMKIKACHEIGIESITKTLPDTVTQEELSEIVKELNQDQNIDGILIQLPLPSHINQDDIINILSPEKDVDGLTIYNQGLLLNLKKKPLFYPCTPYGCFELLKRTDVEISGTKAVVIGRSQLVGLPMALLLQKEGATVTICHSKTENLEKELEGAKIVVIAVGKPELIKPEWVDDDAVVIDVGISPINDPETKKGYRLVGDFDSRRVENGESRVKAYTPVPGGVGPMTIAILLSNTVKSYKRRNNIDV